MLNNFLCRTLQPITIHFIQFPSLLSSLLKKKNRNSFRSVPNFSFSCLSLSQSCLRKSGQGVGRLSEWFQCSAEQHKWKRMRLAVELIPWGKTITSRKTWLDHTNTHSWRTQKHTHTNMPHLSLFYRLLWTVSYQGTHTPHSGVEFYCHLRFLASNGYENKKNHYCAAFCLAMMFSSCVVFPAHSFPWQHGAACLVQLPAVELAVVCKKQKKYSSSALLEAPVVNKTWWSAL